MSLIFNQCVDTLSRRKIIDQLKSNHTISWKLIFKFICIQAISFSADSYSNLERFPAKQHIHMILFNDPVKHESMESLAKHFWKLQKLRKTKQTLAWTVRFRTLVPPTFLVLVFLDVYAGSCLQCSDKIIGDT